MSTKIKPNAENLPNIPANVFAQALTGAKTAKNVIAPYLPEMTAHTQRHASGMTIQNTEFLEQGLRVAESNPNFVSTFVDLKRYEEEVDVFLEANAIISELNVARTNWTAVRRWAGIQARREFNIIYGCVRELHHRNIPPATALYEEMSRLYRNHFGPRGSNAAPCEEELVVIEDTVLRGKQLATQYKDHLKDKTIAHLTTNLEEIDNA